MAICSISRCTICEKVVRKTVKMRFTEMCEKLLKTTCCNRFGATGSMVPVHGADKPATENGFPVKSVLFFIILAWFFAVVWSFIHASVTRSRKTCNKKSTHARGEKWNHNSAKNENSKADKITRRSNSSRSLTSAN